MKKIATLICLFIYVAASAQHYNNVPFDLKQKKYTLDAGMLSLVAEKSLLELKEQTMLTVRINWINSEADAESAVPQQYDYRFEDPSKAPWKITQWKILDGGGELNVGSDNYYAVYHAPATMPKEKSATIAVTLMPQDLTKPKVQLLQTIYFVDNDNVFYFDCPYLGIHQEKYVINNNGGINMSVPDVPNNKQYKNVGEAVDAKQKAALQKLRAKQAQANMAKKGFDLSAITSNAKAIYAPEPNVTTVEINGDKVDMVQGQPSNNKRMFLIVLSIPGKKEGKYTIRSKKEISATITLPGSYQACSCNEDPDDPDHKPPTCMGGNIYITKYDGTTVEGTVSAQLEAQDGNVNPPVTFYSTLSGKFKVKVANK